MPGNWAVLFHDAFAEEVQVLDRVVRQELLARVALLQDYGPQLRRPYADTLKGSVHANMKELRFSVADGAWRIAYAFDPERRAVLLLAADKSGQSQARFYHAFIAKADKRFSEHLKALRETEGLPMAIPAEQLLASLPPEERAVIGERAEELRCEYQTLQDLRLARQLTQERLGEMLGLDPDGVARLEQHSELLLATLRGYLASVGGRLRLIAEFPNRPAVDLSSLSGDENEDPSCSCRDGQDAVRANR